MIGRRAELSQLRHWLTREHRLVTVTGPPGIGKTRLAHEAGTDLQRDFPGGVRRLAVEELPARAAIRAAVDELLDGERDGRRTLLLLDGCDQVVDLCGELVTELLTRTPDLRILVTSRQLLRVDGEAVLSLGPLEPTDAVELFLGRARRLVPDLEVDEETAATVAAVTRAVGGVPLAVELAAARITVLSPSGILQRLADPCRLLTKGDPAAPERHRSLRASVAASAEVCTERERLLWSRMTVFAGAVDLDAVETVCAGDGLDVVEVLDVLDGLLDKSVLSRDGADPRQVRYRLLEPLRAYGHEMLGEGGAPWRRRHAEWCLDTVEQAAAHWFSPAQDTWVAKLGREEAEVTTALDRTLAPTTQPTTQPTAPPTAQPTAQPTAPLGDVGDDPVGSRLARFVHAVVLLTPCWEALGQVPRVRGWLASAAVRSGDPHVRSEAFLGVGWCAWLQGDHTGAAAALADARSVTEAAQPPRWHDVEALVEAGVALGEGRYAAAQDALSVAVGAARAADAPGTEAVTLLLLGQARALARDVSGAAAALQRCLALTETVEDRLVRSWCLLVLGHLALGGDDLEVAGRAAREGLSAAAELGGWTRTDDGRLLGPLLELLGCVAAGCGEHERAAVLLAAAEVRWHPAYPPEVLARTAVPRTRAGSRAHAALGARGYRLARRRGEALSDGEVVRYALHGALPEPASRGDDRETVLTARELEVAELVADGLSNRELAERLVISTRTAQGHVESILRKLGFGSRAQVAAWMAVRR